MKPRFPSETIKTNHLIFLLVLLIPAASVHAQLQADFTTDKTTGCSPLKILLTNKTTNASANAVYKWDLGNGNISDIQNPSVVFTDEKTYSITLTVIDGNKTSVKTKSITVVKKPAIDFTLSSDKGCLPFTANFTATSDITGLSYHWDFGDGSVLQTTTNTIAHTYNFEQTATVSLTASNSTGCANTIVKKDLLKIFPTVYAEFTAEKTIYCAITDEVKFTNNSFGPGTVSYLWDFGDGTSSTEKNPVHVYNKKGIFSVMLTVSSSEGCSVVADKTFYLNIANFTTDLSHPDLLCENSAITFSNTSTPVPTQSRWLIDGTDNYPVAGNAPVTRYFATTGLHTIQLTNTFGDCEETISRSVEIKKQPELSGFIADIAPNCGAPAKVNFSDTSHESVKWFWNFTSLINGPSSDIKSPSYTYTRDDLYTAVLTVYNIAGCSNTTTKQVHLGKPLVGIFTTDLSGLEACEKITKQFTARSTEEITAYKWNFGDGTTSTEKEPLHTFSQPGSYSVKLDYTSINGCKGTVSYIYTIRVHYTPVADFSVQDTVCGNLAVQFTNKSVNAATYSWDFGNGVTSTEEYPFAKYNAEGFYSVRLIAAIGMCADTVFKENIIRVLPPFAGEAFAAYTCDGDRGTVQFQYDSRQTEKWKWDFGDGSTLSYTIPPSEIKHRYSQSGTFNAAVEITNGNCTLRSPVKVFVLLKQQPKLLPGIAIACRGYGSPQLEVTGLRKPDVPYPYTLKLPYNYIVQNGDGTPFSGYAGGDLGNVPFIASINGMVRDTQTIRIISKSVFFECTDTSDIATVIIKGPSANFSITSPNACNGSSVLFEDKSEPKNNIPIVSWEWDWGDGKRNVYTTGGTASHLYNQTGEYYVTLTVTDKDGCTASTPYYSKVARVGSIKAGFTISETVIPVNSIININNTSYVIGDGSAEFELRLISGSSTTIVISPSYRFAIAGEYVIKLIARNPLTGCIDSASKKITVTDFNTGFSTALSYIGNNNKCAPVLARFRSTVPADRRTRWDFGDGFILEDQPNPSHIYNKPGIYVVRLSVYAANRQYTDTIRVSNPIATIHTNLTEACLGQSITLNAPIHDNAITWTWDPGDGQVINSSDSFIVHQYSKPGLYSPAIIVTDANGCSASANLDDKITIVKGPDITVDPLNPVICKGSSVRLTATGGHTYMWVTTEGLNNAALASQNVSPVTTTTYTVNALDEDGCKGSAQTIVTVAQPFKINATPSFAEICLGSNLPLNTTGADTYKWIHSISGLSNIESSSPKASPVATITYTVVGYDSHQCFTDTAFVSVKVNPLPPINAGRDIETIVGSEINLAPVASNDVVRWNWSPPDHLSCTNCPSPVSTPRSDIEYVISVTNQFNCVAKDSVKIKVACADGSIYIPAAFSPNKDGKNDRFLILGKGIKVVKSLRVYNRWGQIIFEKRSFFPGDDNAAWDGMTKGLDAPVGTYVYIAEMECNANESFTRKGTVTLIR